MGLGEPFVVFHNRWHDRGNFYEKLLRAAPFHEHRGYDRGSDLVYNLWHIFAASLRLFFVGVRVDSSRTSHNPSFGEGSGSFANKRGGKKMAFTQALIFVVIGLSASVLFLKDRTSAVLTYGTLSAVAVVIFSMYAAPDVALAEASIGLVFTLFLYMVTLQHRGKLWFGLVEVDHSLDNLEIEIMKDYCENHELELRIVRLKENEILRALRSGKVEVGAAAFLNILNVEGVKMTEGFLETKVFTFGEPTKIPFITNEYVKKSIEKFKENEVSGFHVDLIRYLSSSFSSELPKASSQKNGVFYAFGVVEDEMELWRSLNSYLKEIKENGKLEKMIERHVK